MSQIAERRNRGQWVQTERAAHEAWAALIRKSPLAAQVMHILTSQVGDHNAVVISQKVLARLVRGSERGVRDAVAVLKADNWIEMRQIGGRGTVNVYIINDRVAWSGKRDGIRYSLFGARVVISDDEQPDTRADIRHGGNSAHYSGGSDHVQMPAFETFRSPEAYYATLAHELTHWTKHKTRLDRDFGRKRWGDEGYAREELVAELGAAFLCADLELTPEPGSDHAAYIQSWLKVLKEDKRAIFAAAADAQRAADFLHGLQPLIEEEQQEGVAA